MCHLNHGKKIKIMIQKEERKRCTVQSPAHILAIPSCHWLSNGVRDSSVGFLLLSCLNRSWGWVRGPYLECLTKWSNPQGSWTICESRNPSRTGGWLFSSYIVWMERDVLDVPVSPFTTDAGELKTAQLSVVELEPGFSQLFWCDDKRPVNRMDGARYSNSSSQYWEHHQEKVISGTSSEEFIWKASQLGSFRETLGASGWLGAWYPYTV